MKTKLEIAKEEDRLEVASILVKNGYTVRQARVKKSGSSKYDYYLEVSITEDFNGIS